MRSVVSIKYIRSFFLNTLLFFSLFVSGQQRSNNWYFGWNAGINFNLGFPQPVYNSSMYAPEGCASMSDENGGLLFYSNGELVWNKNHQIMVNGTGLNGHTSSTQSSLAIPQPGNDSIYFLFTTTLEGHANGLQYSLINIKKQNGLGEVIQKNIPVLTNVCEKLTAVRHCNKKDFWIVVRKFISDEYHAYLLSSTGVSSTAVISKTGNLVGGSNPDEWEMAYGELKISPNGKKIAAAHFGKSDFVELCDFNDATGVLTNSVKLRALVDNPQLVISAGLYGLEFSPNSKFLYTTGTEGNYDTVVICQFDVSLPNSQAQSSRKLIESRKQTPIAVLPFGMQIGPDKKIYIAEGGKLAIIHKPNLSGTASQYEKGAIRLDTSITTGLPSAIQGLPNYVSSFFFDPLIAVGNCQFSNIDFTLENIPDLDSVKWDFGDFISGANNFSKIFSTTHIFSSEGAYTAKAILYYKNGCANDTINKNVYAGPFKVFLGNDTSYCKGDSLKLSLNIPVTGLLWSNGSIDNSIFIKKPGKYWVRAALGECIATDTVEITENQLPVFSLGTDTTICLGESATLLSINQQINSSYVWSTGLTTPTITVTNSGQYWLRITDENKCTYVDTISVSQKALPEFSLGKDTSFCEKDTIQLFANYNNADGYLWSNGIASSSIKIFIKGMYWADVKKNGCSFRDSINVDMNLLPIVNIGKDTVLCEGQTLILNSANTNATYLWQDNTTKATFSVIQPGDYYVHVNLNGCLKSDTIKIDYNLKPRFSIGEDKMICPGETITLQAFPNNINGVYYLWQNGITLSSLSVNQAGLYVLQVTNNCGVATDSVLIKKGTCKVSVPNVFTPNGDRINDLFTILNTENITEFNLQIFDRWGNRVFATKDKLKGWDGKYNGIDVPIGNFAYTLTYKEKSSTSLFYLKGTIHVIR